MSAQTLFDHTFILSLDKREEHWSRLWEECDRRGWPTTNFVGGDGSYDDIEYDWIDINNPHYVEGFRYGHNLQSKLSHFNALQCHKNIIEDAKRSRFKSFLMLEDDAYLTERFDEVLQGVEKGLENLDWEMLYLGYYVGDFENDMFAGNNLSREHEWKTNKKCGIKKVETCGGFHGVIIKNRVYDFILELSDLAPLDMQLNEYHHLIKSYLVYPCVIAPRNGLYSNCEQRTVSRDQL